MVFGKKASLLAISLVMALQGADALAAPKKKKKKKAPAAAEETADTSEGGDAAAGAAPAAPGKYGMAGCGLGSLLIKENTMFMQVIAATLNGTGYQTFGITSGTSNCTPSGSATAMEKARQEMFVANNLQALTKEAARGEGETLQAFATTLGCKNDVFPQFAKLSQERYDSVYTQDQADAVLDSMIREVKGDETLVKSCDKA